MTYLITQTLLSSWLYTFKAEDAEESFLKTLNREQTEPSEAMLLGREFEDDVYSRANGGLYLHDEWRDGIEQVAKIVRGAPFQVRLSRPIEVDGTKFLVYGILDALKAGVIYDVKFTTTKLGSKDIYGKYLDSPQHPAYMFLEPSAREFQYLVSDGDDVYIEKYTREQTPEIGHIIRDFVRDMKLRGLYDIYTDKWGASHED